MNRKALACSLALLGLVLLVPVALADIATGVLYIYTDAAHTTLVEQESGGNHAFLVVPGATYYIRVLGITEFNQGDLVMVKIAWTDNDGNPQTTVLNGVPVMGPAPLYIDVTWTVPESGKYCTTGTVHYKDNDGIGPDYVAQGIFNGEPRPTGHFHIVPEITLGALGASVVFLSTLALFAVHKRRRLH